MAKLTTAQIFEKADEWAKTVKVLERAEAAREQALAPIVEDHQAKLNAASAEHDRKIDRLQAKADALKAEVLAWLAPRSKTYAAESERATFGVEVGTKLLERQPDKQKLWDLCKRKGVEFFDLVNVLLAEADKRLGKKDVDDISTRRQVPTRNEYLRLK